MMLLSDFGCDFVRLSPGNNSSNFDDSFSICSMIFISYLELTYKSLFQKKDACSCFNSGFWKGFIWTSLPVATWRYYATVHDSLL